MIRKGTWIGAMAQEDRNRLVEWWLAIRAHAPTIRTYLSDWTEAVREEPILIWHTPAIRYTAYSLGGLILVWIVTGVVSMLTPPPPASARPMATTADFHVVCAHPDCGHHFVINKEFRFRAFPLTCSQCKRTTGLKARRCNSESCRGRWVAPSLDGEAQRCPQCDSLFE